MRQNTPVTIKTSVREAAEVLDILLNTYKCILQSEVEIQKRLEFHPAFRKMVFFRRPRPASLWDTPKTQSKGEKREAPSPPEERIAKKGQGSSSPSYSVAARSQGSNEIGEWQLVKKREKKKDQKKDREERSAGGTQGKRKDAKAFSGRQVRRYYQGISKWRTVLCGDPEGDEGQAKPLGYRTRDWPSEKTRKDEILLVLKKWGDFLAFEKALDQAVGEKTEVKSLVSKKSLEIRDYNAEI